MKFNVRCWRPPAVVLWIVVLWLTGCTMVGSDGTLNACPPVVDYSRPQQARVADEVAKLPEGSLIVGWLADYAVLREQARACQRPL